MSSHRAPHRRRSGRLRAVMSLGAVGFAALGLGAQGTFAFWTDEATVNTGSFQSGTLDIVANGPLNGTAGQGGSSMLTGFSLNNMVPGESQSFSFPVSNNGTVGLTYTISGTATGGLAPAMKFSVFSGTANAQTGTAANGNRTGSCSGTALASDQTYSSTSTPVVAAADKRLLAAAAAENVCVVATLPISVGNEFQGKTLSASLVLDAKQVGAP